MGRDCGNQPSQERRRRLGAAGLVGQASWPVCFFCGAANDGCSRLSAGGGADAWADPKADPLVCAGSPGPALRATESAISEHEEAGVDVGRRTGVLPTNNAACPKWKNEWH